MNKYKAIIFDLDGTAIPNTPNGQPSSRLINVIKQAQPHIYLSAATGRPYSNAEPIIVGLGLTDPCVISAGTQIVDPANGNILWEVVISPEDVQAILTICRPYQYELLIKDELMGSGTTATARDINGTVNVMYLMECTKLDADIILKNLSEIELVTAAGVISWKDPDMIDIHITHKEATKEHAVAKLLELMSLSKEEAVGVGDANNDIHLFEAVGHKVAMGNATDLLKSKADEICEDVTNDGLANLIEQVALQW